MRTWCGKLSSEQNCRIFGVSFKHFAAGEGRGRGRSLSRAALPTPAPLGPAAAASPSTGTFCKLWVGCVRMLPIYFFYCQAGSLRPLKWNTSISILRYEPWERPFTEERVSCFSFCFILQAYCSCTLQLSSLSEDRHHCYRPARCPKSLPYLTQQLISL